MKPHIRYARGVWHCDGLVYASGNTPRAAHGLWLILYLLAVSQLLFGAGALTIDEARRLGGVNDD